MLLEKSHKFTGIYPQEDRVYRHVLIRFKQKWRVGKSIEMKCGTAPFRKEEIIHEWIQDNREWRPDLGTEQNLSGVEVGS